MAHPDQAIADNLPKFILSYNKDLFSKVNESKNEQIAELQAKLSNTELQLNLFKEKLNEEQNNNIEQQKKRTELEVEIKIKEIEIQRLKSKGKKDLEHLEENNKLLEDRIIERLEEIRLLKEERRSEQETISRLNAQIKDLRKAEENTGKRIELLVKEKNFMRNRTGSMYLKPNNTTSENSVSQNSISSNAASSVESLEEVWMIIEDVKDKMEKIKVSIEDGVHEKFKELNVSVIEKDNELIKILTETDNKIRELKNEYRNEIKKLKEAKRQEFTELTGEIDELKLEKVELLKKINIIELDNQNNQVNIQKIKALTEQNENLKRELLAVQTNGTLDKEVISDFVRQIEERESMRANLQDKFKEQKRKIEDSCERVVKMLQMLLARHVKKKYSDKEVQEYMDSRLTADEAKLVMSGISDLGLKLKIKEKA